MGASRRSRLSTCAELSTSRASAEEISTGCTALRKVRAKTPEIICSRRFSKRCKATQVVASFRTCVSARSGFRVSRLIVSGAGVRRRPARFGRASSVWDSLSPLLCASGGTADALASGASVRKGVGVQIPPRARVKAPGFRGFPNPSASLSTFVNELSIDRRTVLKGVAVTTAGAAALAPTSAEAVSPYFKHGVASGDPLPRNVIIWTRVTPTAASLAGSGKGPQVGVRWQVATTRSFTQPVKQGIFTTGPGRDHTVKVDVDGLAPATNHHYRFSALGATSPVGRTRTAPAAGADVEVLRFGVASCSELRGRLVSAPTGTSPTATTSTPCSTSATTSTSTASAATGPATSAPVPRSADGDRLAERLPTAPRPVQDRPGPGPPPPAVPVHHDDRRPRGHQRRPRHRRREPRSRGEGDYRARRAAAMQAYFEWMPIRPTGGGAEPTRIYRQLGFGRLADLCMLDERTYRSPQPEGLTVDLRRQRRARPRTAGRCSAPPSWPSSTPASASTGPVEADRQRRDVRAARARCPTT